MSTLGEAQIPDHVSIFEPSSPESLRPSATARAKHARAYSSTASVGSPLAHESTGEFEDNYFHEHKPIKQSRSNRSSISSFPASVIHNTLFTDTEDVGLHTPPRGQYKGSPGHYLSAFRNPSSVRALQLESEYADSDALSPSHRRSPKISHLGGKSPGSSHSPRRSSRPGTPQQRAYSSSKLKKEFPLVLLHCTLLPPAVAAKSAGVSDDILEAVLPEEYRKRWRTLQDKVVNNSEVKQRGVLIPHPRDDYEELEEKLLEALELETPRIRGGHYIGKENGSDSGFESSSQNSEDTDPEEDKSPKCADCGHHVSHKSEEKRKWEVKVFAANGLMKGGAWAAAWEQMEKVDVQVGVWMPEKVRNEVEERLKALQAMEEAERTIEEPTEKRRTRSNTAKMRHDERMREIYGEAENRSQPAIEEASTPQHLDSAKLGEPISDARAATDQMYMAHQALQASHAEEDFLTFSKRHVKLIWHDQRNLAIVILSILVLFFSVQNMSNDMAYNQIASSQGNSSGEPSTVSMFYTELQMISPATAEEHIARIQEPKSLVHTTESTLVPAATSAPSSKFMQSETSTESSATLSEWIPDSTSTAVPAVQVQPEPHSSGISTTSTSLVTEVDVTAFPPGDGFVEIEQDSTPILAADSVFLADGDIEESTDESVPSTDDTVTLSETLVEPQEAAVQDMEMQFGDAPHSTVSSVPESMALKLLGFPDLGVCLA